MNSSAGTGMSAQDKLFPLAREGDQAAWEALVDACYPMVLRAVRRRLTSRAMRSIYESTDFANDVWHSLAAQPERYDFENIEQLRAFLVQKAQRKVLDELRKQHTQKRDIERVQRLEGAADDERGRIEVAGPDPTPSQIVQAEETRDRIHSGLSDDQRRIIELREKGYNNDEIAKRTGWNVRRVQRFLQQLLESWRASGSGASS